MPRPIRIRSVVWRGGLHLLALLALVALAWRARSFLQLLAVAAILAAAASLPVGALARRGWPRGVAGLAVLGGAALIGGGLVASLVPVIVEQVQSFASSLPELIERARSAPVPDWVERLDVRARAFSVLGQSASTIADTVLTALSGTISVVTGILVVAALTAYLVTSGPRLWGATIQWVHPARRPRVERLGNAARRAVAGYVAGALLVGAVGGAVTAVTTLLLGVPYWLPLAVATAALGVIPFIGAIISGVLVVVATFLTAGQTAALIALIVFVAYQQLEGSVIQPLIQRRTVALNPLLVVVTVLLGTAAGGAFGAVLALPVAAVVKVVAMDALERRRAGWRRSAEAEAGARTAPEDRPAH